MFTALRRYERPIHYAAIVATVVLLVFAALDGLNPVILFGLTAAFIGSIARDA